ncbi:CGNR zinc finger domain-containing protein [Streptomyces sp. CC208A]|uniref:CGNR zinc finger domain-containing protein n=1 Tax=Streptomyces sp. CC208A TaxID=3044573 RepID=UPI0024A995E1|nr:CGNR zinc finger domain-containing protein [Streptomyces sp. CC208A]
MPVLPDHAARHSTLAMALRTAALVNALAGPAAGPGEIAAVLLAHGEPAPVDVTAEDVAPMRAAAARLREVFAAASADEAAALLNGLLGAHTGPLRLTSHGGTAPWHPHADTDDDAPWTAWFLASGCLALTVLLWDRQAPPGRTCASGACGNVFVAHGSGPERRYCSRRCATRERVAAHRRSRTPSAPGTD